MKQNLLLSKPLHNCSFHTQPDDKNIFNATIPQELNSSFGPQYNDKGVIKRTIVGKPEEFIKIAKIKDHTLRFLKGSDIFAVPKRFIRQRTINQNDSISMVSSQRTRKYSDHKDKGSDSTNTNTHAINFDVVEQFNLIQQMKKIGEQIKTNELIEKQLISKMNIHQKILAKKDDRIFKKYNQYQTYWKEYNTKLKTENNHDSLLIQQNKYQYKLETLEMLQSLQTQMIDDDEEQKKKINPLGEMFQKQRKFLKLDSEPTTLKEKIHYQIQKEELLYTPNPFLIKQQIIKGDKIQKQRCFSEYQKLNLSGTNIFEKELSSIKQIPNIQNQRYKLFKHKIIEQSQDL